MSTDARGKRDDGLGLVTEDAGRKIKRPHLLQQIDGENYLVVQLLAITFTTGVLDSFAFKEFGIFLSNQTGNSVLLFLGAASLLPSKELIDTAVSLGTFLLTCVTFGQVGNRLGRRLRAWVFFSSLVQATTTLVAAVLRTIGRINPATASRFWPIVLLSSSAGAQVPMAKTLCIAELPTAMLTSPYADLLCDFKLFAWSRSTSRDRRIAYIICFSAGCVVGAFLAKESLNAVLWLAFGIKASVAVSFLFNPAKL